MITKTDSSCRTNLYLVSGGFSCILFCIWLPCVSSLWSNRRKKSMKKLEHLLPDRRICFCSEWRYQVELGRCRWWERSLGFFPRDRRTMENCNQQPWRRWSQVQEGGSLILMQSGRVNRWKPFTICLIPYLILFSWDFLFVVDPNYPCFKW